MRLLLIRHAEMAGDPSVCPDMPVTGCLSEPRGVTQARDLGIALCGERVDMALCSPYGRALQTAQLALAGRDIPLRIVPGLEEWKPSPRFQGATSTQYEEMLKNDSERYAEETWATELGEGCYAMYARVIPAFLAALASLGIHMRSGGFVPEPHATDISIAVFAHGGSLGVILPFLLGAKPFPLAPVRFAPTGMALVEFNVRKDIHYPALVLPALPPSTVSA